MRRDAIVIGAGHNGLVAAAYLARAGLRVTVVERMERMGGCAATEELWPGFWVDVGAHTVSALHPRLLRDLRLADHGLEILRPDPAVVAPAGDGRVLVLERDSAATARSIGAFSRTDAERWEGFLRLVGQVAHVLEAIHQSAPPSVPALPVGDLASAVRVAARLRGLGRREMMEVLRALPMTAEELVSEWFESEPLRGTLAAAAVTGTIHGPMAAGTAHLLFHQHVGAEPGVFRPGLRVRGGAGRLGLALASAARAAGAEIRPGKAVSRIMVREGTARGVVLEGGEEAHADVVVSSVDAGTTFLRLLDPALLEASFVADVRRIRYRGATAKVHLALSELPRLAGVPDAERLLAGALFISPTVEYVERSADRAKYGTLSAEPCLEAVVSSVVDPSLAPAGRHVMSVLVHHAPYALREGGWDDSRREALADLVVRTLTRYAPNLAAAVLHRHVLTPLDLERRFGLPEGNIYHGEMSLDRLFFMRPVPGWARYATPVPGLYLCGASAHPGGGLTGYPGRNAARRILSDERRR